MAKETQKEEDSLGKKDTTRRPGQIESSGKFTWVKLLRGFITS